MKAFSFGKASSIGLKSGLSGQETELSPNGFDRRAHRRLFVDGEIVEHDHIAGAERRHQDLLDVGQKRRIVDRSVTAGAIRPSRRSAAMTVCVSQ